MNVTAALFHESLSPTTPTPHLSKSRFIAGLQCLRRLWHVCHSPEEAPGADAALETLFAGGHEVGRLARLAFPGGVLVDESGGFTHAARMTRRLIGDGGRQTCGASPLLFEPAFAFENVLVRADILQRRNDGRWRLIEVKATLDVKEHHIPDLAIQRHVLEGCGLEVPEACLMHLNRDYVYSGGGHRLDDLFVIEDVSDRVLAFQGQLPELLREQRDVLSAGTPPTVEPDGQCSTPYACEFCSLCSPALPDDHPALLPRIGRDAVEYFEAQGIGSVAGIPLDHPMSEMQHRARRAILEDGAVIEPEVWEVLAGLGWPRWYMDFETSNPPVPRHRGMSPYNVLPFQWSLHRQTRPGATLEHFEFLADEAEDPRQRFAETLLHELGRDNGPVVVYNAAFEKTRLADLARCLPERAAALGRVADRVWDLLPVVRGHVYHPAFRGSFSLKKVLPALLPHLGYDEMAVADGNEASSAWERLVSGGPGIEERQKLRGSLLEYCGLDTLAMAELVQHLERGDGR